MLATQSTATFSNRTPSILSLNITFEAYMKKQRTYRGADKSLARPGGKQATATEDFDVHTSYL
jgi:hypothetical protein